MTQVFATMKRCRVAIEVGTHSPWVSRLLKSFGHEVIVANARQVQLISESSRKNDRVDAQMLARLARVDPQLLRPIRHRSERAQGDLMSDPGAGGAGGGAHNAGECRARPDEGDGGAAAGLRHRSDGSGADGVAAGRVAGHLRPLLEQVEALTEKIQALEATRADRPEEVSGNRNSCSR